MQVFNLFDARANGAAYFYTSRLQGEPAEGIADHQDHSMEPTSARSAVTAAF